MVRRGRVLIVDDDEAVGRYLARQLRGENEVTMAADGQAALALLEGGDRFDVILCDLQMPNMNGVDFLLNLDQISSEQVERIVFLTASPDHPMTRLLRGHVVMDKSTDFTAVVALAARRLDEARAA